MLAGRIIDNQPLMLVHVGWKLILQETLVLVDTGFTGSIKVSQKLAEYLGIEITDFCTVNMADGKSVKCPSGLVLVSLEGVNRQISVLVADGQPVIGVDLLREFGYTLTIDFPANEFVFRRKTEVSFD